MAGRRAAAGRWGGRSQEALTCPPPNPHRLPLVRAPRGAPGVSRSSSSAHPRAHRRRPAGRRRGAGGHRSHPARRRRLPHVSARQVSSDGYAVTAESVEIADLDDGGDWLVEQGLGRVRIRATSRTDDVFVGIARERTCTATGRHVARRAARRPLGADRYVSRDGGAPSVSRRRRRDLDRLGDRRGTQTVEWEARDGRWAVVVMNATAPRRWRRRQRRRQAGRPAVDRWRPAARRAAVHGRRRRADRRRGPRQAAPRPPPPRHRRRRRLPRDRRRRLDRAEPLALARQVAARDPALRDPRAAVDGVRRRDGRRARRGRRHRALPARDLRLQRRRPALDVARRLLRLLGAGTDRYPPFTLAPADYPATLDVPYPEQLSRGRRWSSGGCWPCRSTSSPRCWPGLDHRRRRGLPSVLAVLVAIAAVRCSSRGRYPRDIFALVVGINRWAFRVIAYAALMRDEYPPFRLDPRTRGHVGDRVDGRGPVDAGGARRPRGTCRCGRGCRRGRPQRAAHVGLDVVADHRRLDAAGAGGRAGSSKNAAAGFPTTCAFARSRTRARPRTGRRRATARPA